MAAARGVSHSAGIHVASEGGLGYAVRYSSTFEQVRTIRSGGPEQRTVAKQSSQQIGSSQSNLGESADEEISWLKLVDFDPLNFDFSSTSSPTGALSLMANCASDGQQPSAAPAKCNTAGDGVQQHQASSESLRSNSALAAFDALMRSA